MGGCEIRRRNDETSARLRARIAGVLYLLIFIVAPAGAATATPLKMLITLACDTGVALIFYRLFKPVNSRLSFVAAVFRLVFVVVMGANSLNYYVGIFKGEDSAAAFNMGYSIALVPFGIHCLLIGFLIFRSTFLPRFLGFLVALAGLCYLTFVYPPLGSHLFVPYILIPGVVGEGSLTLWLLIIGVNAQRWREQSSALKPPMAMS
jgi:hypothetical protein